MKSPEQIIIEQAELLLKNGTQWLDSLASIKEFTVECCRIAQKEGYDEAIKDVRKQLGGKV